MTTARDALLRTHEGRLHVQVQVRQVVPAGIRGGRVQASRSSRRNHEDDPP